MLRTMGFIVKIKHCLCGLCMGMSDVLLSCQDMTAPRREAKIC